MKAHPMVGDTLLAAVFAAVDLMIFVSRAAVVPADLPRPEPWYVTIPVIVGVVAPIVVRRKYPITAAYLTTSMGILHSLMEIGIAGLITVGVMLYTLVAYVGRRPAI